MAKVHEEQHKLPGSMKAWQECKRPRAGKDRGCISYNKMLSINPGVSQINTSCHCVHLYYPCISIRIYIERLRKLMPYYDVANLVTVTKTNRIEEKLCGCGTLRTTGVSIWHQVSRRTGAEVSAA